MIALIIAASLVLLALCFVWFTRKIWFFRDPDHGAIDQQGAKVFSPVYGIVAYIKRIENGKVVSEKIGERIEINEIVKSDWPPSAPNGDGWLIGIAMTALDVHYQYAPIPGSLVSIDHVQHNRNLPMFDLWEYVRITWFRKGVQLFARKYTLENERQTMWIENDHTKIALVLIADKFVSKITTFAQVGCRVQAGEKLSFIGRGSQVDVVICGHPDLRITVKEGDAVHGPKTVLAELS